MYRSRWIVLFLVVCLWITTSAPAFATPAVPAPAAAPMLAPEAFGKLSPDNGATGQPRAGMVISWNPSPTPDVAYSYCVSKNNFNCNGQGRWVKVGTATSATLRNLSAGSQYFWQVRATDSTGEVTYADSGTPWTFYTAPLPGTFNKISPLDAAIDVPVNTTLSWGVSANATSYEYCADTSDNNVCDTSWVNVGSVTSVPVSPDLLDSAVYYWQVRAVNASGMTYANFGVWWTFTTHVISGNFTKIEPVQGAVDRVVSHLFLTWTISDGATGYQYCLDPEAVNNSHCDTGWNTLTATSVDITGPLQHDTDYYWQVQATGPGGDLDANGGTWWHFKTQIAPPEAFSKSTPTSPTPNMTINPTLTWGASTGPAIHYEYCIDQTNDNLCDVDWTPVGTDLSVSLTGLFYEQIYYWQVRAVNTTATVEANGGAWWNFTTHVEPPANFSKTAPTDTSSSQPLSLTLSWGTSTRATEYLYCYNTTGVCALPADWHTTGLLTSANISGLSESTLYHWQVIARNSGGDTQANGGTFYTFSTQGPAPTSQNQSFSMDEDASITGQQLASSNTGGVKVFALVAGTAPAGAFTLHADGTFDFTPPANFNGDATFQFTVSDNVHPASVPYTVTIHVAPVDDAPSLAALAPVTVSSTGVATFTALGTDPDIANGDTLSYALGGTPPAGASIDPVTGVFTWTAVWVPTAPVVTVTVIVSDTTAPTPLTAQRTVSITVQPLPMFLPSIRHNN